MQDMTINTLIKHKKVNINQKFLYCHLNEIRRRVVRCRERIVYRVIAYVKWNFLHYFLWHIHGKSVTFVIHNCCLRTLKRFYFNEHLSSRHWRMCMISRCVYKNKYLKDASSREKAPIFCSNILSNFILCNPKTSYRLKTLNTLRFSNIISNNKLCF